jgi:hypothetical protein
MDITINIEGGNISLTGIPLDWSDSDVRNALCELLTTSNKHTISVISQVLKTPMVDLTATYSPSGIFHGTTRLYLDN